MMSTTGVVAQNAYDLPSLAGEQSSAYTTTSLMTTFMFGVSALLGLSALTFTTASFLAAPFVPIFLFMGSGGMMMMGC